MHGRLRAQPDALGARRHPGRLQPPPARPGLAAVRGDHGRRHPPGPRHRRRRRDADDQRPRGVHAGQRVHPRRERGARALRRGRVLRPRDRGRRRHRAPGGDLDRRRRARARPVEDGHPAVRGAVPEPRRTRSRGATRTTRPTTTSTTRTRSGRPGGRSACRRPTRGSPAWAPSSGRSPRWERAELVRAERRRCRRRPTPRTLEALRPRGWAGEHWSPAIGAEALATRTTAALFDETSFAKIEVVGPGGGRRSCSGCARTTSTARSGRVTYTQLLNRRGGIECDLTVTRVGDRPLPARDRDRVRQPRPRLDPPARARPTARVSGHRR